MTEEFVLVQVTKLAVFTTRMAFMAFVVSISVSSVRGKLSPRIAAALVRENLEILCADFTEEKLMDLSDVFFQLAELNERRVIAL